MDNAHPLLTPDELTHELHQRVQLGPPVAPFAEFSEAKIELGAIASALSLAVEEDWYGHARLCGAQKDTERYWVVTDLRRRRTVAAKLVMVAHDFWTFDGEPFSPTAPGAQARMAWMLAGYAAEALVGRVG